MLEIRIAEIVQQGLDAPKQRGVECRQGGPLDVFGAIIGKEDLAGLDATGRDGGFVDRRHVASGLSIRS